MTLPTLTDQQRERQPLLDAVLACYRTPGAGEEVVEMAGFRLVASNAQPKNVVTLRSFRSDGTVLDEQHLVIEEEAAPKCGSTAAPDNHQTPRA